MLLRPSAPSFASASAVTHLPARATAARTPRTTRIWQHGAALALALGSTWVVAQHAGHAGHAGAATPKAGASTPAAASSAAGVTITQAWIRATVDGQRGTGGFMKLTSAQASELVGVSSAVAGVGELHEMKMQGGVMKMQARTSLALAAGVAQELKPGGFHLMLMDLKQTLPAGSTVPLVLTFKDASGKTTQQSLNVPVALRAPGQGEKDHKQGVDHHGADKHGGHKHGAHQH